jgi:L-lactate dehydrogenase (cytochrome)
MPVITCIEDLRQLAKRRVPRMFYDYADSGSWTEQTYRANESDFAKIRLRQKVARNMEGRTTAMPVAGEMLKMPVVLAPVGSTGMQHADGEILACRAAHRFGSQFTLSTMSVCSIEDVAAAVDAPFWFQLYVMRDRDFAGRLIDRAKAAGCSALVLTLDLQILGQRHKDLKNGLSVPPKPTLPVLLDLATKWRWVFAMMQTHRRTFRNIVGHLDGVTDTASLVMWASQMFDPRLSWDDIAWIKDRWGGKLILKGILDPEDAEKAVNAGVDAMIVSNHGGRQLDGALSSIEALPGIVDAVGDRIEIHMDGGIRSGQDVLKAVALGAKAVYVGRAFVYGLGAMGEAGVTTALEIIHKELDLSMAFCGETDLSRVGRHNLILPRERAAMALGAG